MKKFSEQYDELVEKKEAVFKTEAEAKQEADRKNEVDVSNQYHAKEIGKNKWIADVITNKA